MRDSVTDNAALLPRPEVENIEQLYALLRPVMRAVAEAVGLHCEVVLHDLSTRSMDSTIYAIENGHVTGRSVSGPSTNLGLELLQDESRDHDQYGYAGRTQDGRDLHCSSVYYRNSEGKVIASLCINVDLTAIQAAESLIGSLLPSRSNGQAPREILGPDIQYVLEDMIDTAIDTIGKPAAMMTKQDRIKVMTCLEERGAFHIKRAVDRVAVRLGVSRVTAYSDLETVRNQP